jgi:hypothetical protein
MGRRQTRRAYKASGLAAVVVRFSRSRRLVSGRLIPPHAGESFEVIVERGDVGPVLGRESGQMRVVDQISPATRSGKQPFEYAEMTRGRLNDHCGWLDEPVLHDFAGII